MRVVLGRILRRWWGLYVLAILFMTVSAFSSRNVSNLVHQLMPAILLAVLPAQLDRQSGRIRYWLALPMDQETLTRAYWCASVVVPGLLTTVILGLVQGVWSVFGTPPPGAWAHLAVLAPMSFVVCGAYWFLFIRMGMALSGPPWEQQVWGGLYGLGVGACFFVTNLLPRSWGTARPWHGLLIILAAAAAVNGWRRRAVIIEPMRPRGRSRKQSEAGYPAPARGRDGWLGYFRGGLVGILAMTAFWMLALMIPGWALQGGDWAGAVQMVETMVASQPVGITGIWGLAAVLALIPLRHLRALRALPIRIGFLASLVLVLPWVYGSLVSLELWVIARSLGVQASLARVMVYGLSVVGLALWLVPVVLRWGLTIRTVVVMVAVSQVTIILALTKISLDQLLPGILVGCLLSGWIVCRQLDRSSTPYRGVLVRLGAWDRR